MPDIENEVKIAKVDWTGKMGSSSGSRDRLALVDMYSIFAKSLVRGNHIATMISTSLRLKRITRFLLTFCPCGIL
jgi:hypothetical protein